MERIARDELTNLGFNDEAENFLSAIGLISGFESGLYRLYLEGMPRSDAHHVVADELALFGRRWRSQHLLPPTATYSYRRYQNSSPYFSAIPRRASRLDVVKIGTKGETLPSLFVQAKLRNCAGQPSKPSPIQVKPKAPVSRRTAASRTFEKKRVSFLIDKIVYGNDEMKTDKEPETESSELDLPEYDEAAVKIQNAFRKKQLRRQMVCEGTKPKENIDEQNLNYEVEHFDQAIPAEVENNGSEPRKEAKRQVEMRGADRDARNHFNDGELASLCNNGEQAAIVLQSRFRGQLDRRRVRQQQAKVKRERATVLLQSRIRGLVARRREHSRSAAATQAGKDVIEAIIISEKDMAAIKIQSLYRGYRIRRQKRELIGSVFQ